MSWDTAGMGAKPLGGHEPGLEHFSPGSRLSFLFTNLLHLMVHWVEHQPNLQELTLWACGIGSEALIPPLLLCTPHLQFLSRWPFLNPSQLSKYQFSFGLVHVPEHPEPLTTPMVGTSQAQAHSPPALPVRAPHTLSSSPAL